MTYAHLIRYTCTLLISGVWAIHIYANEVLTKPFDFPNSIRITAINDERTVFIAQPDKKYLISFWASWCVPCITELKHFIPLQRDLQQNGIQLVLINVDRRPKTAIAKFMKKHNLLYNDFFIADMYDAMEKFDATGYPITVAVSNQKVLFRYDYSRVRWDDSLLSAIITGFENTR